VAVGAAALLVAFAVVQTLQLRRTTIERDRAARERDRANRITDIMTGMFKVSDPSEARGKSITAREILDTASNDIDTGLVKDPDLQAQLMHVMATVYVNLGFVPSRVFICIEAIIAFRPTLPRTAPSWVSAEVLANYSPSYGVTWVTDTQSGFRYMTV
jgi:hypothetical protein